MPGPTGAVSPNRSVPVYSAQRGGSTSTTVGAGQAPRAPQQGTALATRSASDSFQVSTSTGTSGTVAGGQGTAGASAGVGGTATATGSVTTTGVSGSAQVGV